jgi:hypothetical protein
MRRQPACATCWASERLAGDDIAAGNVRGAHLAPFYEGGPGPLKSPVNYFQPQLAALGAARVGKGREHERWSKEGAEVERTRRKLDLAPHGVGQGLQPDTGKEPRDGGEPALQHAQ